MPSRVVARQRNWILGSLAVLSLGAWAIVLWQAHRMNGESMGGLTMGMDATLFLALWVAMMMAMMFPAAAPMIVMFSSIQAGKTRQGSTSVSTWLFTGSYLALWALVGLVAYFAAYGLQQLGDQVNWLGSSGPRLGGFLLLAAGCYQLTPFKHACLAKCRSPFAFVMTSWRDGPGGAVQMGLKHGLYCLGCCWLFFAILFPLGMMNVLALLGLTLLILAEKSLFFGNRLALVAAAGLIVYGIAVIISPSILPVQPPHRMSM